MADGLDRTDDVQYLKLVYKSLGPLEREILMDSARRLLQGQRDYGKFGEKQDDRNMNREAYNEAIDMTHYLLRQLQALHHAG